MTEETTNFSHTHIYGSGGGGRYGNIGVIPFTGAATVSPGSFDCVPDNEMARPRWGYVESISESEVIGRGDFKGG